MCVSSNASKRAETHPRVPKRVATCLKVPKCIQTYPNATWFSRTYIFLDMLVVFFGHKEAFFLKRIPMIYLNASQLRFSPWRYLGKSGAFPLTYCNLVFPVAFLRPFSGIFWTLWRRGFLNISNAPHALTYSNVLERIATCFFCGVSWAFKHSFWIYSTQHTETRHNGSRRI